MKILYFHVPKTAGSSINELFVQHILKNRFHIENVHDIDREFCNAYDFISGHVTFAKMKNLLNLDDWITLATFREPLSYTVSHLTWVRKLADEGEEVRLRSHPPIIQKIAKKMLEYDFSKPIEITAFILWLEKIEVFYFHNTQTIYMHPVKNSKEYTESQMNRAKNNLEKIDFVGIQEEMDRFMEILGYEFGWDIDDKPRVNVNQNTYGFDISDHETQKALLPLYEKDLIIYEEAKKHFHTMASLYTGLNEGKVISYIKARENQRIKGWARYKNSLKKVELELCAGEKVIGATTADQYRADMKKKKVHITGRCGFEFILTHSYDPETLSVRVKGSDVLLPFKNKK